MWMIVLFSIMWVVSTIWAIMVSMDLDGINQDVAFLLEQVDRLSEDQIDLSCGLNELRTKGKK